MERKTGYPKNVSEENEHFLRDVAAAHRAQDAWKLDFGASEDEASHGSLTPTPMAAIALLYEYCIYCSSEVSVLACYLPS